MEKHYNGLLQNRQLFKLSLGASCVIRLVHGELTGTVRVPDCTLQVGRSAKSNHETCCFKEQ